MANANIPQPNKLGLEPIDLQTEVTTKIETLAIGGTVNEAIPQLVKKVGMRQNKGNTATVDRRRASNDTYVQDCVLPADGVSPLRAKEESSGKRGTQRHDRTTVESYHNLQSALFDELKRNGRLSTDISHDERGWLMRNNTALSTPEFCQVLDGITIEYARYIDNVGEESKTPPSLTTRRVICEEQQPVFNLCKKILLRRISNDWQTANNLNTVAGMDRWQTHKSIIVSFAALLATLQTLALKFGNDYF